MRGNRNGSRERLAWAFLLAGFAIWLALVVAVPVTASSYLQNARRSLVLMIQANEGTVGLEDRGGRRPAVLAGDPPQELEGALSILTNTTDTALVNVQTPDEEQLLARFEVYGNTNLEVVEAEAPRFRMSSEAYEVVLNLKGGRLRLNLPPREGRTLNVVLQTPQSGEVLLQEPGEYALDADNTETWVTVQEGQAVIQAAGESLALGGGEAGTVNLDAPPTGPVSDQRDLLKNGDFNEGLAGWDSVAWEIERADQPVGATSVINQGGEQLLRFHRVGEGASEAEVQQTLKQDVTGYESLEIGVTMRITNQSLEVCGSVGSECPLFLVVNYDDVNGVERTWQQGFYAVGTATPGYTPGVCQPCAQPVNPHVQIPLGQLRSWESGNLLEKLAQENVPPRRINSVILNAQGHSFETHILDVSLVARE